MGAVATGAYQARRIGNPAHRKMDNTEETKKWQRNFAVTCNNEAWALAEKPHRTPDENSSMLQRAWAAAYHWFQVGGEVERNRAESLVAHVHGLLGHGDLAMTYAQRNHDFVLGRKSDDWEIAFAHAILANAAHAADRGELHREQYAKAKAVGENLSDPQDKKIFMDTFAVVTKPE